MARPQEALAFDFGMKHIGVATINVATRTIDPKGVLKAKNGRPNTDQLDFVFNTWEPTDLVVGLPLNMDDTESPLSKAARKFGGYLERRFQLPVHFVDERLSSFEARERSPRGEPDHSLAAVAIGETWLHDLLVQTS